MALPAGLIHEVRSGGSDSTNGGGFNPANANFPTDLAATSGNTASPVVTSASYTFVAGDVGAYVFVKAGGGWNFGWYKIASVAGGAATLDAAIGHVVLSTERLATTNRNVPIRLNTIVGVSASASPTGGVWGIDYSQQDSAQFAFTDLVIGGTTTQFTSAAKPVGKNFVGNILVVTGGSGFTTGRFEIVTTSGTTGTCDRSLGTGASTGGTGGLGGAWATFGAVAAAAVAGNRCYLNAATYAIPSGVTTGSGWGSFWIEGYGTYRTDGTRAVLQASAAVVVLTTTTVNGQLGTLRYLAFDGNATGTKGLVVGSSFSTSPVRIYECKFYGFTTAGADNWADSDAMKGQFVKCEFYSNAVGYGSASSAARPGDFYDCVFRDNAGAGAVGVFGNFLNCSFYGNGAQGLFHRPTSVAVIRNCTFYNNTSHGWHSDSFSVRMVTLLNCISYGNGGFGANESAYAPSGVTVINCAFGGNTSGHVNNIVDGGGNVILTANPFVDPSNGNFGLNTTAGGGAACRAVAFPGTLPDGTTMSYADVGVAQHQEIITPAGDDNVYFGSGGIV